MKIDIFDGFIFYFGSGRNLVVVIGFVVLCDCGFFVGEFGVDKLGKVLLCGF